nr:protein NRT1/ PTR FAMILY 6.2-like [Ipomoea batatas]
MSCVVADAVDYRGLPADKSKTGGWVPAALALGIEIVERLSTMGIGVNLVTYLGGTMHQPSSTSANVVTDFMGTSFLLCLLGGFLADSFLGRFKTIAIFSTIQAVGTGILAIATKLPQLRPPPCEAHQNCEPANGFQMGILYLALYLIALGTGGLKSSVSGFGTDQFDEKDEKEKVQMNYFFHRFFFFVSMGTLAAVTVLVYIQDEVGRSLGYGICSISMVVAMVLLLSGIKRYRYKKSLGSPIVHILQVIQCAIRKRKMALPYDVTQLFDNTPPAFSRIHHTDQFLALDKAAIVAEGDFEEDNNGGTVPNPWKLSTVTRVEEVKMMVRLLPIWATTILFWTTYAQMMTYSVIQASTMERSVGNFQIPAGSLTVFFVAAILITLAVYDRVVMPIWKKWKGTPDKEQYSSDKSPNSGKYYLLCSKFHQSTKNGHRPSALHHGNGNSSNNRTQKAKRSQIRGRNVSTLHMSVFNLIPQFFLIGSGEAFIYTGQLDFFITQSPKGMKTMSTGLFLTTLSLGFFVSSFLVSIVKKVTGHGNQGWLADNINYGRLDCFYGLLAILGVVNFALYVVSAVWFKRKTNKKGGIQMESMGNLKGEEKC